MNAFITDISKEADFTCPMDRSVRPGQISFRLIHRWQFAVQVSVAIASSCLLLATPMQTSYALVKSQLCQQNVQPFIDWDFIWTLPCELTVQQDPCYVLRCARRYWLHVVHGWFLKHKHHVKSVFSSDPSAHSLPVTNVPNVHVFTCTYTICCRTCKQVVWHSNVCQHKS